MWSIVADRKRGSKIYPQGSANLRSNGLHRPRPIKERDGPVERAQDIATGIYIHVYICIYIFYIPTLNSYIYYNIFILTDYIRVIFDQHMNPFTSQL
jgi:hypothetical protein